MKKLHLIIFILGLFLSIQSVSSADVTINPGDSIQDAIDNADPGDTILMNTGTYNQYNIQVNKELTLKSSNDNPDDVIIDAQENGRGIEVLAGVNNVILQGLTITNGNYDGTFNGRGAGISNQGGTSDQPTQINNCKLTNNHASEEGGAIYNYGYLMITNSKLINNTSEGNGGAISNRGNLDITGSTIQENQCPSMGGGIYNLDTMTINGCTIQRNQASLGGGILNDGDLTVTSSIIQENQADNGGGIDNFGTMTITDSIIQKNSNGYGGGIINWNDMTITRCTIQENTAISGGGILNFNGNIVANFNRIVNNTPESVVNFVLNNLESTGEVIDFKYNWWGSNNPDFSTIISGNVDYRPWLFMTITANPSTINNGGTSLISVSFNNQYDGTTYTAFDPSLGHIPNGTPVTFNTDKGSIGSKTIDKETTEGVATATLTADETAGVVHVNAVTDDQTVNTDVNINPKSSAYLTITPSKENPVVGDTVNYTLKVGNRGPDPAQDVVMTYTIPEGLEFAGATVDVGTYNYDPATRTITWTIGEVPVGDPYMWLDLKILKAGQYQINPRLSTTTYDPTLNRDTQSIMVNAAEKPTPTPQPVHGKTVPMQKTGTPLAVLALAVLMVLGGIVSTKK